MKTIILIISSLEGMWRQGVYYEVVSTISTTVTINYICNSLSNGITDGFSTKSTDFK